MTQTTGKAELRWGTPTLGVERVENLAGEEVKFQSHIQSFIIGLTSFLITFFSILMHFCHEEQSQR